MDGDDWGVGFRFDRRVVRVLVLCVFLCVSSLAFATGPSVAGDSPSLDAGGSPSLDAGGSPSLDADGTAVLVSGETATLQSDTTIQLTQEFRLTPDRAGEFEAVFSYDIPNEVSGLNVTLFERATVVGTSGFEEESEGYLVWDEQTAQPSITMRVDANQTVDRTVGGKGGDYRFVDVGEWALVARPRATHGWEWRGGDEIGFERTLQVAGEGAAGDTLAYLGPGESETRSAHGQTIRLFVPEAATLAPSRSALFSSLFDASDSLRVGDRDEHVFLVAAPADPVEWGVGGVQLGDADAWVLASEGIDGPNNVWVHEYVHTRQDFSAETDTAWLNEGMADYYAGRLTLEQDRTSFDAFREYLARGTRTQYDGAVLADPTTWQNAPDYDVGALVTGELDRRIRVATDSGASFDRVFERLNEQSDSVSASEFVAHVEAVAGSDVADAAVRYTTTTERPEPWNATQHGVAFGRTPARFSYAFGNGDGETAFEVAGPYREGSIGGDRPITIVTGETLSAVVRVSNTGDAAGEYEATLTVDGPTDDGTTVGPATGRLEPGASTTHTLGRTFERAGEYTITVGDTEESVTVSVREPADPTVTAFGADQTRVEPGTEITLSIDLANEADRPAAGTVPVTLDGREIATRSTALASGESETATVAWRLDEAGEYTFGLGDASERTVTVFVEEPFPTTAALAAGGGLLALLFLGGVFVWWRGRGGGGPPQGRPDRPPDGPRQGYQTQGERVQQYRERQYPDGQSPDQRGRDQQHRGQQHRDQQYRDQRHQDQQRSGQRRESQQRDDEDRENRRDTDQQ